MLNIELPNIVLCLHKSPDKDCYLSALIIFKLLKRKYRDSKNIYFVSDWYPEHNNNRIPYYSGTPAISWVHSAHLPEDCHLIIIDHTTQGYSLCGDGLSHKFKAITVVDHHFDDVIENEQGNIQNLKEIRNINAAACTEVIYDGLINNKQEELITSEIAKYIYDGIASDTFSFNCNFGIERLLKTAELVQKYKVLEYIKDGPKEDRILDSGVYYILYRCMRGIFTYARKDVNKKIIICKLTHSQYKQYELDKYQAAIYKAMQLHIQTYDTQCILYALEAIPGKGQIYFRTRKREIMLNLKKKKQGPLFIDFGFSIQNAVEPTATKYIREICEFLSELLQTNPELFQV